jgi:hypothetical protein
LRSSEGKNPWATGTRSIIQRRFQTTLAIAFADPPNGSGIVIDFVAQYDHPLLLIGSAQQDLGTTGDFEWRLTITQQFLQEDFVLPFQYEFLGVATAHGSSLHLKLGDGLP